MKKQREQDLPVQAYVRLIRTGEGLHNEVSRGLAIERLTASQFSTLKVLRLYGPLAQRDIAKYLLKSGGNITIVVDNLEREGLVARVRDTDDRRVVFVRLTNRGAEMFDSVYPGHLERIRGVMGALTDAECEQLVALLEKLQTPAEEPDCTQAELVTANA